jgi:Flp pilus assembly protein TadD
VDPKNIEAMIFKGRAIIAGALESKTQDRKKFDEARTWFSRANKLDTEDPEPLMEFYKSFVMEGLAPTKNAVEALHYASNLVPQDAGLRLNSAVRYLQDKDAKKARETLAPIAYDPHGRGMASMARKMITKIDAGDAAGAQKLAEQGEPDESDASGAQSH